MAAFQTIFAVGVIGFLVVEGAALLWHEHRLKKLETRHVRARMR